MASRSALRNPERCITWKAARNKRPRVRSGSRGAARLRLSLFLPANIPTSMHVTTAIVEANVLPASRIADTVSSNPRRVFSVGYKLTGPRHGDVHESALQNSSLAPSVCLAAMSGLTRGREVSGGEPWTETDTNERKETQ